MWRLSWQNHPRSYKKSCKNRSGWVNVQPSVLWPNLVILHAAQHFAFQTHSIKYNFDAINMNTLFCSIQTGIYIKAVSLIYIYTPFYQVHIPSRWPSWSHGYLHSICPISTGNHWTVIVITEQVVAKVVTIFSTSW